MLRSHETASLRLFALMLRKRQEHLFEGHLLQGIVDNVEMSLCLFHGAEHARPCDLVGARNVVSK